jgi:acyl carrier protein
VTLTERELIDRVIEWLRQSGSNRPQSYAGINDETDLFAAGLIDSLGFVELITFIESHDGCRVNLVDADPAEFALIGGLCRLALKDSAVQPQNAR